MTRTVPLMSVRNVRLLWHLTKRAATAFHEQPKHMLCKVCTKHGFFAHRFAAHLLLQLLQRAWLQHCQHLTTCVTAACCTAAARAVSLFAAPTTFIWQHKQQYAITQNTQ
jgi:hypothetical protein